MVWNAKACQIHFSPGALFSPGKLSKFLETLALDCQNWPKKSLELKKTAHLASMSPSPTTAESTTYHEANVTSQTTNQTPGKLIKKTIKINFTRNLDLHLLYIKYSHLHSKATLLTPLFRQDPIPGGSHCSDRPGGPSLCGNASASLALGGWIWGFQKRRAPISKLKVLSAVYFSCLVQGYACRVGGLYNLIFCEPYFGVKSFVS